jgi:hypothetical protein
MSKILKEDEFHIWFNNFLPDIVNREPANLLNPVTVSDRSDPKIVHLDGLNLSRAWCMFKIALSLPENDASRSVIMKSAILHANNALPNIVSGSYEGEHWLATFAVYLLTNPPMIN